VRGAYFARHRDPCCETLAALHAIRDALAGLVTGADGVNGARRALRRIFESFALHRYESASATLDADLAASDWYIVPTVGADAILSPLVISRDDHDEPMIEQAQELRRVPVSRGEKLSGSPSVNLWVFRRYPAGVVQTGS
jgi:hypothetical protein